MQKNVSKFPFDPKNPPRARIYVGLKIPIYLVDDDDEERIVNDKWDKTNWYFKVVALRRIRKEENGKMVEDDIADIEWPNEHVDTNVPINYLYGGVSKVPRSTISRFTEEYNSDDDDEDMLNFNEPQTNQEKITKLFEILQNIREGMKRENLITVEETTEEQSSPPVVNESKKSVSVKELLVKKTVGAKEPKKPAEATKTKIEPKKPVEIAKKVQPAEATKKKVQPAEATKKKVQPQKPVEATKKRVQPKKPVEATKKKVQPKKPVEATKKKVQPKKPVEATKKKEEQVRKKKATGTKFTEKDIRIWFRPPLKGGKTITELRDKARQMDIENPQRLIKPALKKDMLEQCKS